MKKILLTVLIVTLIMTMFSCKYAEYDESKNNRNNGAAVQDESSVAEIIYKDVNIAAGKSYTFTGLYDMIEENEAAYTDNETNSKLIDGIIGAKEDVGYASLVWIGMNIYSDDCYDIVNRKNCITMDLGTITDKLTKFVVYNEEEPTVGIGKFASVEVFISDDNTTFVSLGMAEESLYVSTEDEEHPFNGIYAHTLSLAGYASARYVKFVGTHDDSWAFVSEVEVYQNLFAEPEVSSSENESTIESAVSFVEESMIEPEISSDSSEDYVSTVSEESSMDIAINGFVFDIDYVDMRMIGEDGMVITSEENLITSDTAWTVLIPCEKVADNLYIVKENAIVPEGKIPEIELEQGDIIIAIHSAAGCLDENLFQRNAAIKVTTGMYFTLDGINLTAKTTLNGTATVSITDPRNN